MGEGAPQQRRGQAQGRRRAALYVLAPGLVGPASAAASRADPPRARARSDFYDHYFDLLTYLHSRKGRLATFRESVAARQLPVEQAESEWSSYKGREIGRASCRERVS